MEEVNLGIGKFIFGARPCDTCHSAPALIFCRVDSLFLCLGCDSKVHTPHARHELVWLCEVCEHAPAIITCKADSAVLCAACDHDIHSANPLARRHERVPVVPFLDASAAVVTKSSTTFANGFVDDVANCPHTCFIGDETTTLTPPSWGFPNATAKLEMDSPEMKSVDFLFSHSDQFLEFDCNGTDSVVPVQTMKSYEEATAQQVINQLSNKYVDIDFTRSKFNSFNPIPNFGQPISQSISSSSMDVGIVPDGNSMSDTSYPYVQTSSGTVNRSGSTTTTPTPGSDREAKVMRYREKRKNRKFEKTIRYASRKAYAETRPRIKGRFAKRSEIELGTENKMFVPNSPAFMAEATGYGIVSSF